MKRRDLVRQIEKAGCVPIRRGGRHDWYQNPENGACQPLLRHTEIKVRDDRSAGRVARD